MLHYIYLETPLDRKFYFSKLLEYMSRKYDKKQTDIYTLLNPYLNTAIKNAKKIARRYTDANPSECNPCTKVYEIFDMLKNYL